MNENTYTRSVDSETHCPSFLISVRPNQNCFLCRLNPLRLISSEISLFSLLDSISTSLAFWLLQNLFASYQFIGLSLNLCSSIGLGFRNFPFNRSKSASVGHGKCTKLKYQKTTFFRCAPASKTCFGSLGGISFRLLWQPLPLVALVLVCSGGLRMKADRADSWQSW